MSALQGKVDFEVVISVKNANPNGDPLNGNSPRINMDGYGEMSDVCIKRKIRNRLQDMGEKIFVQSEDRTDDGYQSLKERADGCAEFKEFAKDKKGDRELGYKIACKEWFDVRAFGQVFAFKGGDSVSLGVRGPVSIQQAVSIEPVDVINMQITKSVNSEAGKDGKASDTMGTKSRVGFGIYVIKGSINVQQAEKTGFSQEDADRIKECLKTLFENDASSARPEGSMEVCRVYWWQHKEKTPAVSSAKIHRNLVIKAKNKTPKSILDYDFKSVEEELENFTLNCVKPEIYDYI